MYWGYIKLLSLIRTFFLKKIMHLLTNWVFFMLEFQCVEVSRRIGVKDGVRVRQSNLS